MKATSLVTACLGTALIGLAGPGYAAEEVDLGKTQYEQNCAVCHGASGKGETAFGDLLKSRVPDLTTISKRNGGVFPFERIYETIDGRLAVAAHGTREMPIWGKEYGDEWPDYYLRQKEYNRSAFVRSRILALVDYIYRFQAK